jgi:hypothetical protein
MSMVRSASNNGSCARGYFGFRELKGRLALVSLLCAITHGAWAQVATAPSVECHVSDGTFTTCPNGGKEWSDVTPVSFPASNSYLYVNQDAGHQNLYLMYDLPFRTNRLAANDSVHINFSTVEQVSGIYPKLIIYDIYVYGNQTVQILQQGKPTPAGNIVAAVGFGPSPNSATPHVTAELQVPLAAGPPSTYSSDPNYWGASVPPTPPPPPDPPDCQVSVLSVCIKTQDQIGAWEQEADAANEQGDLIWSQGLNECDAASQAAANAALAHADAVLANANAIIGQEADALEEAKDILENAQDAAEKYPQFQAAVLQIQQILTNITFVAAMSDAVSDDGATAIAAVTVAVQQIAALTSSPAIAEAAESVPEITLGLADVVAAVNIYQAGLVAVTQAEALVAQATTTVTCLAPIAAEAAVDYAQAALYNELAADPPDPNYTVIATPVVPSLPGQPYTTATGFNARVVNDLNALITNSEQEIALLEVIPVSINRVAGAVAAGSAQWQAQQANAVQTYASQLIPLINNESSLRAALSSDLLAAGLGSTFSANYAFSTLASLKANGIPSLVAADVTALGLSTTTQSAISAAVFSTAPQSVIALGSGAFPQGLTDASLNLAANAAVNALNALAATPPVSALKQSFTFTLAGDYATAGVGLRGLTSAAITLSGVPPGATVQKAFLYWGILDDGEDLTLKQLTLNGAPIVGTRIGSGPDTCWGDTNSLTYRADVTPYVAGNGTYTLTNVASGGNILAEGASLVVVYQLAGAPVKTVMIDDGNLAIPNGTPTGTASFTFTAVTPVQATTTFNVGDGQAPDFGPTPTSFTGDAGTINFPNLFSSLDGLYWDTATFNVSSVVSAGPSTGTATITIAGDCLLWSAQVFSVTSAPVTTPTTATAGFVVASPTGITGISAAGLAPNSAPTISQQITKIVQFRAINNPRIAPGALANELVTGLVNDGVLTSSQAAAVQSNVMNSVVTPANSNPQICDVNGDGEIDVRDIDLITAVLNTPAAGPTDPRDANKDGVINALDARICVTKCTNAGCAIN